MLRDLVLANRSYRRFVQSEQISEDVLRELVDLGRMSASAANLQPLRFVLSSNPAKNDRIFATLRWAGYLADWQGPDDGEKPSAYIIILSDTEVSKSPFYDAGISAQSILLGASEKGYGGCLIGSIDQDALRISLAIPEQYDILLVMALGKPAENVVVEDVETGGSIKYYRDAVSVHHVPKRKLDDLILGI